MRERQRAAQPENEEFPWYFASKVYTLVFIYGALATDTDSQLKPFREAKRRAPGQAWLLKAISWRWPKA